MIGQKIRITPDDGEPFEVEILTRDMLAWERTAKGKTFQQFSENISLIEVYRLTHIAARRLGLFAGSLQEYEATCEIDMDDDEEAGEEPDPTPPAPSTGRSSRSR